MNDRQSEILYGGDQNEPTDQDHPFKNGIRDLF